MNQKIVKSHAIQKFFSFPIDAIKDINEGKRVTSDTSHTVSISFTTFTKPDLTFIAFRTSKKGLVFIWIDDII